MIVRRSARDFAENEVLCSMEYRMYFENTKRTFAAKDPMSVSKHFQDNRSLDGRGLQFLLRPECFSQCAIFVFEVVLMGEIFGQIRDNLRFFSICVAIAAGVIVLAKLAEHFLLKHRQVSPARRVSIIGMCTAVATVLYTLDFPVPFLAPPFYKLDFSEIPVLLCGFFLGPSAGVICLALKVLIKLLLTGTTTAFVGDLANFVVGCTLVLPAVIVYHLHKSKKSALAGLALGTACMAVFGSLFNAVYLIPEFSRLFELPLEAIIAMGAKIYPSIDSVNRLALLCVVPLNLVKGVMVGLLTMLLYKHVSRPLFREK